MLKLHITNSEQRDANVRVGGLKPPKPPTLGITDGTIGFRRYVTSAPAGLNDALMDAFGDNYGQALVDGDPEVDTEVIGRFVGDTDVVYLSATGDVLHAPPQIQEILSGPDGAEKERRDPEDVPGNVNETDPVRWTGKKVPKKVAIRKFAFKRTLQIRHVDGLTYDFLHKMAKELADEGAMVLVGAGSNGKNPLVFQTNGTSYRAFLEGRVDGNKYQLLMHLSNMELKTPPKTEAT